MNYSNECVFIPSVGSGKHNEELKDVPITEYTYRVNEYNQFAVCSVAREISSKIV